MVVSTVQATGVVWLSTSLPRRPREMGHTGGCPSKANDRAAARMLVGQHLVKFGRDAAPPWSQASGAQRRFWMSKLHAVDTKADPYLFRIWRSHLP